MCMLVSAVTATDLDSVTNSQLTYSVTDNSFSVQTLNNIGYIKTARYTARLLLCLLIICFFRPPDVGGVKKRFLSHF